MSQSTRRYSYDPAAVKELLAEADHPDGITIKQVVSSNNAQLPIMEVIQAQLSASGITLDMQVVGEIEALGRKAVALQLDVSKVSEFAQFVATLQDGRAPRINGADALLQHGAQLRLRRHLDLCDGYLLDNGCGLHRQRSALCHSHSIPVFCDCPYDRLNLKDEFFARVFHDGVADQIRHVETFFDDWSGQRL